MNYDVIIIGAGLSGLSSAALLAKRGLKVAVVEHSSSPGGSCGIFKRKDAIFDQGAAMLYGFGEKGFNTHRFLFNCLEENIQMIKHDLLYTVNHCGQKIRFHADTEKFTEELAKIFPHQKSNIKKFYKDMEKMYRHVISGTPTYTTPDQTNPKEALKGLLHHPVSYIKFMSYLNKNAEQLLKKYFTDPKIFNFFDKLTSTYCYATVSEAPAILAAVMFIDNHEGGSFYPAGSTLFLPGKLEKIIEENRGDMYYNCNVKKLLLDKDSCTGVITDTKTILYAPYVIYSGTVWDLYNHLLPEAAVNAEDKNRINLMKPTYPSTVLYTIVQKSVIPDSTCPIEMLVSDPSKIDENEITLYILSIDDHSLCDPDHHTVIAIGPSFKNWNDTDRYESLKEIETERILNVIEKRFPGFRDALIFHEIATPKTIERYTMKPGGAVAGPKQMLGQHMLKRQHIKTKWHGLLCCGESTVIGTGTPAVTASAIAAANVILKETKSELYKWKPGMKNYVDILKAPMEKDDIYRYYPSAEANIMREASKCMLCEKPSCCKDHHTIIPDIMRRCACGNFYGAYKAAKAHITDISDDGLTKSWEKNCIKNDPVKIHSIISYLFNFLLP